MSTFGLRTFAPNGATEMDTDSFTYQVIHNSLYQLSLGGGININLPEFDPANCVAVILPTQAAPHDSCYSAMPFQAVSPGIITVRSDNPSERDKRIGSTIQFRLLVMRYRN